MFSLDEARSMVGEHRAWVVPICAVGIWQASRRRTAEATRPSAVRGALPASLMDGHANRSLEPCRYR